MHDTPENSSYAPFINEVRTLREVMDTRFDANKRELDMFGEIIGRISAAVERLTDAQTRTVNLEARLAHTEAELSDLKLDQASIQQDLQVLKDEKTKTTIVRDGVMASVGGVLSAVVMKLIGAS